MPRTLPSKCHNVINNLTSLEQLESARASLNGVSWPTTSPLRQLPTRQYYMPSYFVSGPTIWTATSVAST